MGLRRDRASISGIWAAWATSFPRSSAGAARAGVEPRGDTLEAVVEVPFRVAMLGGKIPVTLPVTETCPTCNGSGGAPGATLSTCPECKGRGTISFGQGNFAVNRPCPQCRGRGRFPRRSVPPAAAQARSGPSAGSRSRSPPAPRPATGCCCGDRDSQAGPAAHRATWSSPSRCSPTGSSGERDSTSWPTFR